MLELREYQSELLDELRNVLKNGVKSIVAQAATGFGKTALASTMLVSANDRGKRTIFMVHRKILIKQVAGTLAKVGLSHSYIAAKHDYDPDAKCYIAIVNTLSRKLDKIPPPDFLVVDEAHIMMGGMATKVIDWARQNGAYIIGLTATPKRFDGRGLGQQYQAMCEGKPMDWLIQNGYLSKYRYYAPAAQIDKTGFKIKHGDYDVRQVAEQTEKPQLVGDVVANYIKYAGGKRAVLFAPTVKVSEQVVAAFIAAGIPAAHLDGETDDDVRGEAIEGFADGNVMVLCNVAIMTEGFDLSSYVGREVPVEAVILYTATASLSRYLQCVGRGLRPKPEPAIIIDHGNSCAAFGLPDEPREWTLADEEKQPRGKKNKVRIMTCKKCYAVHRPAPVCPECGYVHDLGRKVKIVDGELVEVDSESKYTKAYKAEYARLKTLQALRGYKRGWVFYMMQQWKLRQISRTE